MTDAPITAVFAPHGEPQSAWRRNCDQIAETPDSRSSVTDCPRRSLREQVPLASPAITAGLRIDGQRFVDPGRFVRALGHAVEDRGGTIRTLEVRRVSERTTAVIVNATATADVDLADVAVMATGAWLPRLAGRSACAFRYAPDAATRSPCRWIVPFHGPIYLPEVRVACTPYQGGLRVAGTMEFRDPHEPLDAGARGRDHRLRESAARRGALGGTKRHLGGSPPGHPRRPRRSIGEMSRGVYVAGGHGMWGLAHGPVTGRLLAEQITTGKQPEALREFDPLR